MPFADDDLGPPESLPPTPPPGPSLGDVAGAALRDSNSVVSMYHALANSGPFAPSPGYSARDLLMSRPDLWKTGDIRWRLASAQSEAEANAIVAAHDQQTADKTTLAASGSMGYVVGAGMGLFDPTNLLPGRVAIRAWQESRGALKGAIEMGTAMAVQSTAQETALQASQPGRPLSESALNVGSSTLLGAFLGGAAGFLSPAEHAAIVGKMDQERAAADAHVMGAAPAGAAAVDMRTMEDLTPVSAFGLEKLPDNIVTRTLRKESLTARRAAADLAETAVLVKGNLEGKTTTLNGGPPLETISRHQRGMIVAKLQDTLAEGWSETNFAGQDAPWAAKLRDDLASFGLPTGLPTGRVTFEDFKKQVGDAVMNDGRHDNPHVQRVAEQVKSVFDEWATRAEQSVEGFKRAEQVPGEGYFPHVWNKVMIQARRPAFVDKVTEMLGAAQGTKKAIQDTLRSLQGEEKTPAVRARIEEQIGKWQGKSAAEAKAAIKAREAPAAKEGRPSSADEAVDRAVARILGSDRDRPLHELRARADEIVDRIISSPDGRLPYDERAAPDHGPGVPLPPLRGSLAERPFNVSNAWAHDWIERDIERVVENHLRTFVPDVLLSERFGDAEMSSVFRQINEDYAKAVYAAGADEKAAARLGNERNAAITDIAILRDRLRGLYRIPTDAPARNLGRISAAVRNFNVLVSMGLAAISSIPDTANVIARWGLGSVFNDAWAPYLRSLMTNRALTGEAYRQFKAMGIAMETVTAARHHEFSGITEPYARGSRFETTLQWGADKMQLANLMGPQTDILKTVAATVASTELHKAAKAAADGTATKAQLRALGEANIPSHLYERIAGQYEASGTEIDGVVLPNTQGWTDKEARSAFEGALHREVNLSVVTPGIDKPAFLSDPLLAVLTQFKSFTAAATTRILIANLQRSDAQTLQGLIASLGFGAMAYYVHSAASGQPVSDKPADWVKEAVSRSNWLGWLDEANTLGSKMTRGTVDLYRAVGADKPLTRAAGRSVLEQLIGPTFGKMQNLAKVTGATSTMDWQADDVHALRRLVPMQNLWFLNRALDRVETAFPSQPQRH